MRTYKGALVLLFIYLSHFGHAFGFHLFKDTQGREMEAKITRISGDDVYIERRDGLSTKVKQSIFCEKDQAYIEDWAYNALLESDFLEVRFTTKINDKRKSSNGGIEREEYKIQYNMTLNNTSYSDLADIRVEYLILKFEDLLSAPKRSQGNILRFKGSIALEQMHQRETVTLTTELIPMLESQLEPGYIWANGAKRSSKDKLEGIWVKIFVGDKLVREVSKPENMMRKEPWEV